MATVLRVKRRVSGATGAPAGLKTAELAWNMVDGILYGGFGDDGSGNATSVKALAKQDYVDPSGVYQLKDADLDAIADLDATTGLLVRNGAGSFIRRALAGTANRITVTNGDGVSGAPTFDLATVSVGSNTSGGSTKFTVDGYGRVTNASQASLSDLAAPTGNFSMNSNRLTNVAEPATGTDVATKNYVDTVMFGIDDKDSVRAATTAALPAVTATATTLTANANGLMPAQDGVTLAQGNRLLVKNQAAAAQNGIYVVTQVGSAGTPFILTRADDMNSWGEVVGARTVIEEGSDQADQLWIATADQGGTLGTTAISWTGVGTSAGGFTIAGAGLTGSGNTLDIVAGTGISVANDDVALTGQVLALHNVATAADKLIYATGSGTFGTTDFTGVARTLLSQTSQSLMRSTGLGLGTIATQDANNVAITGGSIDGVTLDGGTF